MLFFFLNLSDVYHNSKEGSDVSYPTQVDCVPIGLTSLAKRQNLEREEYTKWAI
jgi:hypothetical protein